jgi:hypothetical protein
MHVLAPQPADPKLPLFFNVDESVGNMGVNNPEDVLLVQFMMRTVAEMTPAQNAEGASRRERMLLMPVSDYCDEATMDGIRAWQEGRKDTIPGTVVDGRVSPARGYFYGGGEWTIVDVNVFFRKLFPNVWPRLQDVPNCPPALQARAPQVL